MHGHTTHKHGAGALERGRKKQKRATAISEVIARPPLAPVAPAEPIEQVQQQAPPAPAHEPSVHEGVEGQIEIVERELHLRSKQDGTYELPPPEPDDQAEHEREQRAESDTPTQRDRAAIGSDDPGRKIEITRYGGVGTYLASVEKKPSHQALPEPELEPCEERKVECDQK